MGNKVQEATPLTGTTDGAGQFTIGLNGIAAGAALTLLVHLRSGGTVSSAVGSLNGAFSANLSRADPGNNVFILDLLDSDAGNESVLITASAAGITYFVELIEWTPAVRDQGITALNSAITSPNPHPTSTGITTTGVGFIISAATTNNNGTKTPTSGFTALAFTPAGGRAFAQYKLSAAPESTTAAWTDTATQTSACVLASYTDVASGVVNEKTQSDGVSVNDGQIVSRERGRHHSESALIVEDFIVRTRQRGRVMFDSLELLDSFIRSIVGTQVRVMTDNVTIAEGTIVARYRNRYFVDVLLLDDSGVQKLFTIECEDGAEVGDVTARSRQRGRVAGDAVSLNDQMLAARLRDRLLAEGLGVSDNSYWSRLRGRMAEDMITVVDQQEYFRLRLRDFIENIAAVDFMDHSVTGIAVPLVSNVRVRLGASDPVRLGANVPPRLGGYN